MITVRIVALWGRGNVLCIRVPCFAFNLRSGGGGCAELDFASRLRDRVL